MIEWHAPDTSTKRQRVHALENDLLKNALAGASCGYDLIAGHALPGATRPLGALFQARAGIRGWFCQLVAG
jgi:hypothetical protein